LLGCPRVVHAPTVACHALRDRQDCRTEHVTGSSEGITEPRQQRERPGSAARGPGDKDNGSLGSRSSANILDAGHMWDEHVAWSPSQRVCPGKHLALVTEVMICKTVG